MGEIFGSRYDDQELGRGDDFLKLYPGKPHRGYYTGKDYGAVGHTEVISMGIQLLAENPAFFAEMDREFFKFVIRVMRGAF